MNSFMTIFDIFPALNRNYIPSVKRNTSWTKKGPGRRHNILTSKQQTAKNHMMQAGMTASRALETLGVI